MRHLLHLSICHLRSWSGHRSSRVALPLVLESLRPQSHHPVSEVTCSLVASRQRQPVCDPREDVFPLAQITPENPGPLRGQAAWLPCTDHTAAWCWQVALIFSTSGQDTTSESVVWPVPGHLLIAAPLTARARLYQEPGGGDPRGLSWGWHLGGSAPAMCWCQTWLALETGPTPLADQQCCRGAVPPHSGSFCGFPE